MRYQFDPQHKNNTISFALAGVIIVLVYFTIENFTTIRATLSSLLRIMLPFVVGFALAFLVAPMMNYIENKLLSKSKLKTKNKRKIAASVSVLSIIAVFTILLAILLPQLLSSINQLTIMLPRYLSSAEEYLTDLILQFNIPADLTAILVDTGEEIFGSLADIAREYLPRILNASFQIASFVFSVLVGLIIALYILLERERFGNQFKKLTYALFSREMANRLLEVSAISSKMFNRFIVGKTIDSFIIGILCFVGMTIFGWPYALLISVIIGITNMIPVFGPFIGAVPSLFILFIVNPMYTIWFALFILVLQQIDGNIIGPKILGDSMGLPSLWIMFAIIVGGGFFGILGMFLGVPVFAIIYVVVKELVNNKLKDKNIQV